VLRNARQLLASAVTIHSWRLPTTYDGKNRIFVKK